MLEHFVAHRRDVVTRRTRFELRKAESARRSSKAWASRSTTSTASSRSSARRRTRTRPREHRAHGTSRSARPRGVPAPRRPRRGGDREARRARRLPALASARRKAILDMRLAAPHRPRAREARRRVRRAVRRPSPGSKAILGTEQMLMEVIIDELKEISEQFGDERRTEIQGRRGRDHHRGPDRRGGHGRHHLPRRLREAQPGDRSTARRSAAAAARPARRDARGGLRRAALRRVDPRLRARLHRPRASVYWLKVLRDPAGRRAPRAASAHREPGRSSQEGEKVAEVLPRQASFEEGKFVDLMATRARASSRRPSLDARYANVRVDRHHRARHRRGRRARRGAASPTARRTCSSPPREGMAIRFEESDVRAMGRGAYGVKGITLRRGRRGGRRRTWSGGRASPRRSSPSPRTATASARELAEYRVQGRGGRASSPSRPPSATGKVVGGLSVARRRRR